MEDRKESGQIPKTPVKSSQSDGEVDHKPLRSMFAKHSLATWWMSGLGLGAESKDFLAHEELQPDGVMTPTKSEQ